MYIFISYATKQKAIAGKIQKILESVGIESFLAHEDIEVSSHWRDEILRKLGHADVFISILSEEYDKSFWCVQESGIAAFRSNMTLIPLSIDGTIPKAFANISQSAKIVKETLSLKDLLPGLIKHDFNAGVGIIIELIKMSASYRNAEENYKLILPYLSSMHKNQVIQLLKVSAENRQVYKADLCINKYIPPLLMKYNNFLPKKTLRILQENTL